MHPDLAMSDEAERLGPFSNKKCKDGHIFYGPSLVTRNKRQRSKSQSTNIEEEDYVDMGMPPG